MTSDSLRLFVVSVTRRDSPNTILGAFSSAERAVAAATEHSKSFGEALSFYKFTRVVVDEGYIDLV